MGHHNATIVRIWRVSGVPAQIEPGRVCGGWFQRSGRTVARIFDGVFTGRLPKWAWRVFGNGRGFRDSTLHFKWAVGRNLDGRAGKGLAPAGPALCSRPR